MKLEAAARIPEERVAEILTRAAELDRDRRETITVEAIRAAALDAGISPTAVDAALSEYAARGEVEVQPGEPERASKPRFGRMRAFFRRAARALKTPFKLGGFLLVLGLAGAAGEGAVALGWITWIFLAGRLVREHRPSRRVRHYVLGLTVMTLSLGLGFAMGGVDEDLIGIMFTFALPLLVLGIGIIKLRLPKRFRSSTGELEAPAA